MPMNSITHFSESQTKGNRPDYKILFLLGFGHLAVDMNQGALPVLLPRLFVAYDLSYSLIGVIMLVFTMGSSLIQPLFGYYSDKKGALWLLPVSTLVAGFGMAMMGLAQSYYLILLAALVSGIGVAAFHPEASKAAHFVSGSARATAMSIFSVGGNLGYGLGPVVMAVCLAWKGIQGSIYLLIPATIMACIFWYKIPQFPSGADRRGNQGDVGKSGQTKWFLLVTLIMIVVFRSFILSGFTTYVSLYLITYLNQPEAYADTIISLFLLAGALGNVLGGPLADRYGEIKVIGFSFLTIPPLILTFLFGGPKLSMIAVFLAGMALVSTFSSTIVLGQSLMPGHVGIASGLMLGFAVGMGGVGAMLLGLVADKWGIVVTMLTLAGLPLGALLLTIIFFFTSKQDHDLSGGLKV